MVQIINGRPACTTYSVVGAVKEEQVGLYVVHNPFMTSFAAMSFRPQLMVDGATSYTHNPRASELFCRNAQDRIEANFAAVGKNHNRLFNKVTNTLMAGKLDWMYNDIYDELAPEWHKAATAEADEPASQTEPTAKSEDTHVTVPE